MTLRRIRLLDPTISAYDMGSPNGPIPVIEIDDVTGQIMSAGKPTAGSGGSPTYGSSVVATWNNDVGLSRSGPSVFAIGNTALGDFTGGILAANVDLGPYSAGGQGSFGQINGITHLGGFPPDVSGYGTAVIDVGIHVTSTPTGSAMGINSAVAVENNTHNIFALNGQIASPALYSGNIIAGMYCVYGETDHNGSGTMGLSHGVFGASYQQGSGFITTSRGGYFESCSGFYRTSTGGIAANYGLWVKSGGLSGTLTNDWTVFIESPYTGATFINGHTGLRIGDQSAGGVISGAFAIKVEGSSCFCDFGQNAITFNLTNASISYKGVGVIGIGTGNIGAVDGTLQLKEILMTDFGSAPTSSGTAGTAGEIIYHSGILYFCSASGAAGAATWNKLNVTAV